jgi:hypothetical protein
MQGDRRYGAKSRAPILAREVVIWCENSPMKKFLAVLAIAFVLALAVWVAMRVQQAKQQAKVPELLPRTTLVLAHLPNLKRMRDQWHESDVYQIWREPSVQAWLQKPLAKLPQHRGGRKTLDDFLRLGPTHGFVALTSIENNEPKLIGGFHFGQTPEETRKFIEQRKGEWLAKSPNAKREKIIYEQHEIETVSVSRFVLASTYHNHWFFAANDLATLQALLDRADHLGEKSGPSLQESEAFSAALKHLVNEYAAMVFIDPQPFLDKLLPLVAMSGQPLAAQQLQRLKQVRSIAATLSFDQGKMRETDFVAMPRLNPEEKLARLSLGTASANTFLYSASLMHWPENMLAPSAPSPANLPAIVRQLATALSAQGISGNDLRAAFGDEVELIGAWPADTRWPSFLAALPVKDAGRARKVADAIASIELAGAAWTRSDRNGATFYNVQPFGAFVPLSPTIAVSDKKIIAGSDVAAVEAALTAPATGTLEKNATFREAADRVPAADSAFNYIDTRLLFERADAALRPLLLMSATFYPAVGRNIDAGKLPPSDAIAKHLAPIVMSQRYATDGYLSESSGPVTFNMATIGVGGTIAGVFAYLHEGLKAGGLFTPGTPPAALTSPTSSTPTPTPP